MADNNPHQALWQSLKDKGLYTKSYDEFTKQFAGNEKVAMLFNAMKQDGHYGQTASEFGKIFSSAPKTPAQATPQPEEPTSIRIRDNRETDMYTGQKIKDTTKFHANPSVQFVQQVVSSARKHGQDPYDLLSATLAETHMGKDDPHNPFMLGNYDQYGDIIDQSVKFFADKMATAKKLGITDKARQLQVYNGTKTLANRGIQYGIDTNKTPIDMSKTPLYGQRLNDLTQNVLKKTPELVKIVEDVMRTNPNKDIDYYK